MEVQIIDGNPEFVIERAQIVRQIAVLDHHALRRAGRPRGVNHISEVVGARSFRQVVVGVFSNCGLVAVEQQDAAIARRKLSKEF